MTPATQNRLDLNADERAALHHVIEDRMTSDSREQPHDEVLELGADEKAALKRLIEDRLWWDQTMAKAKTFGAIAAFGVAALVALSVWWPWITRIVQFLIKDVPS